MSHLWKHCCYRSQISRLEFVICGTRGVFNQNVMYISRFCHAYTFYKFHQSQSSWCNFSKSSDRYIENHFFSYCCILSIWDKIPEIYRGSFESPTWTLHIDITWRFSWKYVILCLKSFRPKTWNNTFKFSRSSVCDFLHLSFIVFLPSESDKY
jgi:hypothetical protein